MDIIKYHVIKVAVNACELNDIGDKFYNNSMESMNKLIKHWQNNKKIDLFSFAREYEELTEYQETDVLRAFLGLSSPYLVREEFVTHKKEFNTEYAPLLQNEKTRIRKVLLNVPVDSQNYKSASTF